MCLAVYLGTHVPLDLSEDVPFMALGIEPASWTPPPLKDFPHVYYLGQSGHEDGLACSCLLAEYVVWTETGATITSDDLYPPGEPCPFEALQQHCKAGAGEEGYVTLVCDDSGGAEQRASEADYDAMMIRLHHVARGNLLFAEPGNGVPCRSIRVVNC